MSENPIYSFALPIPNRKLSPNARIHWAVRAEITKENRENCFLSIKSQLKQNPEYFASLPFEKATIKRTFFFKTNRRRDKDNFNAMTKSTTDSLVDAGLLKDDDKITWMPTEFKISDSERLIYEVYELE